MQANCCIVDFKSTDYECHVHLFPVDSVSSSGYFRVVPNVKFSYLYRDSGNYKTFNDVTFTNSSSCDIAEIEKEIRTRLIDDTWLYAERWMLPSLIRQPAFDEDPTWHEFDSIEITDQDGDTDIETFLNH